MLKFGAMTIDEFEVLTDNEKAETVWQGTFLCDRQADDLIVQLYSLASFYAEIVYDPAQNTIREIRAFTSHELLVPYLAHIKFNLQA